MPARTPEFQPRRFRSTVPYYARYRLGYPERLIGRVAKMTGLKPGERVLDLGCGPGLLALPFARLGASVIGVDPEPDMLAAASAAADEAGLSVEFREGSSFDLPPDLGAAKLVTMGRSFHWMDRAIALFGENRPTTRENSWRATIESVGNRYGTDEASFRKQWSKPERRAHVSYLFDSSFCSIEGASVFVHNALSTDDIIGRILSLSLSSPEKLGERRVAFEADLRAALAEFAPDDKFTEIAEIFATVARRP